MQNKSGNVLCAGHISSHVSAAEIQLDVTKITQNFLAGIAIKGGMLSSWIICKLFSTVWKKMRLERYVLTILTSFSGGLPIGATLVKQHIADAMQPGDHGSTFAGNPLVCHTAQITFDVLSDSEFLEGVTKKGEYLRSELSKAIGDRPEVEEVRGLGLICGIQLQQVESLRVWFGPQGLIWPQNLFACFSWLSKTRQARQRRSQAFHSTICRRFDKLMGH